MILYLLYVDFEFRHKNHDKRKSPKTNKYDLKEAKQNKR